MANEAVATGFTRKGQALGSSLLSLGSTMICVGLTTVVVRSRQKIPLPAPSLSYAVGSRPCFTPSYCIDGLACLTTNFHVGHVKALDHSMILQAIPK